MAGILAGVYVANRMGHLAAAQAGGMGLRFFAGAFILYNALRDIIAM